MKQVLVKIIALFILIYQFLSNGIYIDVVMAAEFIIMIAPEGRLPAHLRGVASVFIGSVGVSIVFDKLV